MIVYPMRLALDDGISSVKGVTENYVRESFGSIVAFHH